MKINKNISDKRYKATADTGNMTHLIIDIPVIENKKLSEIWNYLPKDIIPKQKIRLREAQLRGSILKNKNKKNASKNRNSLLK